VLCALLCKISYKKKNRPTVDKYRPSVGSSNIFGGYRQIMAKQAERRQATRDAIVRAAAALIGEKGFAASSIEEIAAAAGVAKGAVYHHFPSKEAVFEAVLRQTSAAVAADITARAVQAPDVLAVLVRGMEAYFEICSQGPTGRIVLKDGPAVLGWERWREIDEEHFGRAIPQALGVAMGQGLVDRQPIGPLSRLLLGAVTEAAAACAASADPAPMGREYAAAFERLIQGLRRR
jgi:AcrR family transcriptional regulator